VGSARRYRSFVSAGWNVPQDDQCASDGTEFVQARHDAPVALNKADDKSSLTFYRAEQTRQGYL
jgi:hypothetical protein